MTHKQALLIIDVQVGLINFPKASLYEPEKVLNNIKMLIKKARESKVPVIYVQHQTRGKNSYLHKSSPNWLIHPEITPLKTDVIIHKRFNDSFKETELNSFLKENKIKKLFICGLQTEFCVDTTVRQAFSLDYDVVVVEDAHSTYDSDILKSHEIIAHHNHIFNGRFAELQKASKIRFSDKEER
ncbi:MAG: cysteine hydrolase family protein [Candidatus Thorarchaeota archaeon]